MRGKAAFLSGHPVEGTRAFVERERYCRTRPSLRASREELFGLIREAAGAGRPAQGAAQQTDPIVAGWLALGTVAVDMARNPMRAGAALAEWKRAYPQHPANDSVLCLRRIRSPSPPGFLIR